MAKPNELKLYACNRFVPPDALLDVAAAQYADVRGLRLRGASSLHDRLSVSRAADARQAGLHQWLQTPLWNQQQLPSRFPPLQVPMRLLRVVEWINVLDSQLQLPHGD